MGLLPRATGRKVTEALMHFREDLVISESD